MDVAELLLLRVYWRVALASSNALSGSVIRRRASKYVLPCVIKPGASTQQVCQGMWIVLAKGA